MIDYRLQVFYEVAVQQNISAASKILHLSQPAVTQHIKRLEDAYGTSLFIRSRYGMRLTEAGMILLAHTKKLTQLEEEVFSKLRHPSQPLQGHLRLGASSSILHYFLPSILMRFKQEHPKITIDILGGNSATTIGALLDQRIDIGLIEAPCRRRDLKAYPFFEDEIVVIASPKNPLSKKRIVTLQQLLHAPFVFREQGSGTRQYVEEYLQRAKIKPLHIIQEFPSIEGIKRAVALDMGLGFVSRMSITNEIDHGTLKVLSIPQLKIQRYFSIILALGADSNGLRQVFLNYLPCVNSRSKIHKKAAASKQK